MADLSAGRASVPHRVAAPVPEHEGLLAAMPGYTPSAGALASKLVTLFPVNAGATLPTHQAVIALFDPDNGRPTALIDGTAITAIRTGRRFRSRHAASRPRGCARARDPRHRGPGPLARPRGDARPTFQELRVAGRDRGKAEALAEELAGELDLPVRAAASWEEACDGADVVCATTHALEPVVRRESLASGTHVTSVGYNPHGRELDDATIVDALVVVESREAALAPVPAGANDLTPADRARPDRRGPRARRDRRARRGTSPGGARPTSSPSTSRSGSPSRTPRQRRWRSPLALIPHRRTRDDLSRPAGRSAAPRAREPAPCRARRLARWSPAPGRAAS